MNLSECMSWVSERIIKAWKEKGIIEKAKLTVTWLDDSNTTPKTESLTFELNVHTKKHNKRQVVLTMYPKNDTLCYQGLGDFTTGDFTDDNFGPTVAATLLKALGISVDDTSNFNARSIFFMEIF